MDAVYGQKDLVHRQAEVLVRVGRDFHRPVVGADEQRILLREPFGRSHAHARRRFHEARVVLPVELAPAGVDDDGVSRQNLQLLPLERLLQIGHRDLIGVAQHLHAFERRDVEHHAAREERRGILHPELGEAGARCDLACLEAVVV